MNKRRLNKPQNIKKFNNLLYFLLLYLTFGTFNLLNSSTPNLDFLNENERNWIKQLKTPIRLAPDPGFEPIEIKGSNNELAGLAGDYINLIEKKLGITFEIVWYDTWSENVIDAEKGNVDLWSAVVKTPQRSKYMNFTDPYLNLKPVFITKKALSNSTISLKTIGNRKLGVIDGWFHQDLIKKLYPKLKLYPVKCLEEGLKELQEGNIDIFISDIIEASYLIQKLNFGNLTISGIVDLSSTGICFASTKNFPLLNSILIKVISRISEDEKDKIYRKWVKLSLKNDDDQLLKIDDNSYAGYIFISAIVIQLLFLAYLFFVFNKTNLTTRKKHILLALTFFILLFITFFLYNNYNSNKSNYSKIETLKLTLEEKSWLEKYKDSKLKLAPDYSFAPIEWIDEKGVFKGIASEYVQLIEKKLNIKFEILKIKNWSDNVALAKNGKIDIWSAVAPTSEKMEFMNFTPPYLSLKSALIVNSRGKKNLTLKTIKNEKIAVVENYFTHEFLKSKYPQIDPKLVKNAKEGLLALAFNQVDGMFIDIATASYFIKEEGISSLEIRDVIDTEYNLAFASKINLPILNRILTKTINSISKDENKRILNKWIGKIQDNRTSIDTTTIIQVVLIVLFIFLVVILWISSLKRLVKIKTSELLNTQESLKKSKTHIQNIFDSTPSVLLAIDKKKNIIQWNRECEKRFNTSKEEAIGKPLENYYPQFKENIDLINSMFSDNKAEDKVHKFQYQDQNTVEDITIFSIISNSVKEIVIRIDDVTKQKEPIEQLNHSRKLDSIGQLAGGIAHDFNNILAGIMGAAQLLQLPSRNLDSKSLDFVNLILKSTVRASDLTSKLLSFSRKNKISSNPVSVHDVLEEAIALLSETIDKSIVINMTNNSKEDVIKGDQSNLQNTFINLAINASHAMPNGGILTFETKNVSLDDLYCKLSPFNLVSGNYIVVEVRDTGAGISPEIIDKIFEPFFTTKEQGKGTGLGLSSAYGIIRDHNGAIEVKSELDNGTVFIIYLPISEGKPNSQIINEKKILNREGQILLVDDEEIIRLTGEHLLSKMGYKVLLAKDGAEGVDIYKQNYKDIDLVIMDMLMPKMNGKEAFYKLLEINHNCKVVIASGFTKNENIDEMLDDGLKGFISKPYTTQELDKLISKIL